MEANSDEQEEQPTYLAVISFQRGKPTGVYDIYKDERPRYMREFSRCSEKVVGEFATGEDANAAVWNYLENFLQRR